MTACNCSGTSSNGIRRPALLGAGSDGGTLVGAPGNAGVGRMVGEARGAGIVTASLRQGRPAKCAAVPRGTIGPWRPGPYCSYMTERTNRC